MENIETKNLKEILTIAREIVTMKRDNAEWELNVLSDSERKVLQEYLISYSQRIMENQNKDIEGLDIQIAQLVALIRGDYKGDITTQLAGKAAEYENILNQLKADYAVLEDSKEFRKLLSEMKKVEEKLQAAKSFYNKYTSELNDLIRLFPSNVVAKMHGISIKPFFDGKNMQDEIFDDFKL